VLEARRSIVQRYTLDGETVVSVQEPVLSDASGRSALAVLFDGRPMLDEGIPETMRSLQAEGALGPLTTMYVESIEGSTTRGPTRVASLTDPAVLDRFAASVQRFLEDQPEISSERARRVVLGHSLGGNAALHVASRRPDLFGGVATGSAALWWPGDEVQMSGGQVVEEILASTDLRLWMQVGVGEDANLVRCNRELWARAVAAGLDLAHLEHPGGHELSAWRSGLRQALPHLLPRQTA
jgi:enterochelin esterase-like enzyme